jgi:hypothetical protein
LPSAGGDNKKDQLKVTSWESMAIKFRKDYLKAKKNISEPVAVSLMNPYLNSKIDQLRVRAMALLAEHYFLNDKFDLSLQLSEEIIASEGFSSYVFDTLEIAVKSSRALNLNERSEQYQSVLTDIFSQG